MRFSSIALFASLAGFAVLAPSAPICAAQPQIQSAPSRIVGSVTAVGTGTLTVRQDNGAPVTITVGSDAHILETQPGAKTLAGATHIQLNGIDVGDRVLAAVQPSAGGSPAATMIICMKQSAIAQRREAEEAAWRQGVGGLVKSVDTATGTITITSGPRTIAVHTTPATTFRRYSPNSVKFADTTPSTIAAIHPGDQLRARGPHAPGATELSADAVVSGTFRNISATVLSVDAAANTVTVHDLATKKPVVIHINSGSQLHKLPRPMAEHLAALFKHPGKDTFMPKRAASHMPPGPNEAPHAGDNLTRTLARTPTIQLSDLHKGDAVMIVATQGTPDSATAVALVAGVEPILTASPSASQSMFSASWNVGGGNAAQAAAGTP